MNKFTAIILTKKPNYQKVIPGVEVLITHSPGIKTAEHLNYIRLNMIRHVKTEFFFYLDDDDHLPNTVKEVLEQASLKGTGIVYTDELWIKNDGTREVLTRQDYTPEWHLTHPQALHHLLIFNTQVAMQCLPECPMGDYWTECTLSYLCAERAGASYIPEVGYVWRQSKGGLSKQGWIIESVVRSASWCARRYLDKKNGS